MKPKAKPCKHSWCYEHAIWEGRTPNEVTVGRYCWHCGLQQAARANKWGRIPKSHPDMRDVLKRS